MLIIKDLYKFYGKFSALSGLNMHVNKGDLYGFVGPNGAGKTTTMRICVGLLAADGGEIYIDGEEVLHNTDRMKEKIGYVPDFFGAYDNMTAIEYLQYYAATYGFQGEDTLSMCEGLLDLVKLSDKRDTDVNGLSRGMKQRLCMARGLVHNPDLLFLDEPASGLDPRARYELKLILRNLTDMGKTIVISSHILAELAEMCNSVGIVDRGRMVLSGDIEELLHSARFMNPLMIAVEGPDQQRAVMVIRQIPAVKQVRVQGRQIVVQLDGGQEIEQYILRSLINNNIMVSSFRRDEGSLEELFMKMTGKSLTAEAEEAAQPNKKGVKGKKVG